VENVTFTGKFIHGGNRLENETPWRSCLILLVCSKKSINRENLLLFSPTIYNLVEFIIPVIPHHVFNPLRSSQCLEVSYCLNTHLHRRLQLLNVLALYSKKKNWMLWFYSIVPLWLWF